MDAPTLLRWLAARDIRIWPTVGDGFDFTAPDELPAADVATVYRHGDLLAILLTEPWCCRVQGCACWRTVARAAWERGMGGGRLETRGGGG